MNDIEFEERAAANPFDKSAEFLAAIQEKPEREKFVQELQSFDAEISQTFNSVTASAAFKEDLLQLAETADGVSIKEAANDSLFWTRKVLPVAASLLIAIAITLSYSPAQENSLDVEIFSHIYSEAYYLEVESILPMSEVNGMMTSTLGSRFKADANVDVHVISDCVVAQQDSIHMVMEGDVGAVTVILLPSSPVEEERRISDERFEGLITPTPSGNLVVVGEKSEAISRYTTLLASNISW